MKVSSRPIRSRWVKCESVIVAASSGSSSMSRWSVILWWKQFASARCEVIVFFSAENTNPPSTARPALMPPTGTPRAMPAFTASSTGVSFQIRT